MSATFAEADRPRLAQEALGNPVLAESLTAMRAAYIVALRGCDAKDDLGRYRYAVALNVVDAVERHLRAAAESGRIDEIQTNELSEPKRRWIPRF